MPNHVNSHTARAEAQNPETVDHGRWVTPEENGWWYHDNDNEPGAVPAELPTDADQRRKVLDWKLIRKPRLWSEINCYDCGMRTSRPIHGRCFE